MTTIYATSGQTNLTKRLHRHSTWTVQSYSPGGANMHPHLTHASWATPVHIPNGISIDSAVFAQLTTEAPYTLQWAAHFSLRISLAHEGSEPHLIHASLGLPDSTTQTAYRSVQPFLQGSLAWQTDRPRYLSMYVVLRCDLKTKTNKSHMVQPQFPTTDANRQCCHVTKSKQSIT